MVSMQNKSHLTVIFITVFLYLVGFGVMIPVMPIISREYGASPLQVGLLMSSYSLMQFIFAPFWGRLSDRYGRRPILLFCLTAEVVSYMILGLASSLTGLFVARLLAGFFGASLSTASASISDITAKNERSKGMALIGAAFGLGFVVGPALGGLFAMMGESLFPHKGHLFGMQFAAFGVSAICICAVIFAWFKLKETVHLSRINQENTSKQVLGRFATLWRFLGTPVTGPLIGNFFLNSFAMSIMEATLILLTSDKFGWGIKEVSFGFAYIGLLSALNQGFLVRTLLPIYGEKLILHLGLVFQILSYLLIFAADSVAVLAIAMTFLSFGNGFVNPSLLGSISLSANPNEQGEALGTAQGTASLGRILGPALGGYLYANLSLGSPFLVSAGLIGIALLVTIKMRKVLPNSAKHETSEIDKIDSFQFNNLVYNRVRFLLLHDNIDFAQAYSGIELEHLRSIGLIIDFNTSETLWIEKIRSSGLPEQIPIVILKSTSPLSEKSAKRFKKLYAGNVCLVTQSWSALKKDLVGSENSI